jgi:hypothetical protein
MNVITLLACHSNSDVKIRAILHNLPFLWEISYTIVIINSPEFAGILENKIMPSSRIIKALSQIFYVSEDFWKNIVDKY